MPLDTRIALGVQPLQVADPLAQYGQVQNILAAQTQQQASQLHMQQVQRQIQQDDNFITKMSAAITNSGGPPDIRKAAELLAAHPQHSQYGMALLQSLARRDQAIKEGIYGPVSDSAASPSAPAAAGPSLISAAPSATDLPAYDDTTGGTRADSNALRQAALETPVTARAPVDEMMQMEYAKNAPAGVSYEQYVASQNTGAVKPVPAPAPIVETRNLPARGETLPPATAITNNLSAAVAPASTTVANNLVPAVAPTAISPTAKADATVKALEARYLKLSQYEDQPGVKEQMGLIKDQIGKLNTYHVVGRNLANNLGEVVYTAPHDITPSEFERVLKDAGLTPEQQIKAKQNWITKQSTQAPGVTVNVSTEKKYGEKLAGNIADRDDAKLGAAEKAPELAASANRIIDLVKQGNLFTGPIADVKLNIARALNVVGASNEEKIANTEALIAATGQSTLDAIKGAGLGTGAGFTDKDLNFLRGIAGGTIELTPQTLTRLATLQHQTATRSVQAWNTRFKDIPKSSVESMGLRTAPDVPPLSSVTGTALRPAINSIQGGYKFKGGDPAVQSNWEKQ